MPFRSEKAAIPAIEHSLAILSPGYG